MTFSQFAQVLHTYCSEAEKQSDFVIHLVDKIMGGRPGRVHGDDGFQNPLRSKDVRSLQYYYSGKRQIPTKDAIVILSSVDKYKFEKYLKNQCSDNAQILLKSDLEKIEKIPPGDIVEVCADLFEQILHDLAAK